VTSLGRAAIALGAKGMRVFPCWPRKKEPAIRDNLRLAAVDETIIRRFWGEQGLYNIGVATGRASGVWVLDVDGHEGRETMRRLEAEHGPLPPTVEVITGNGRHLYWKWPDGFDIRNFQVRNDLPGLDVRGEGGYVLAPPSIHPSGRAYAWSVDSASQFAVAPDWLTQIVTERSGRKSGNGEAVAPATPRDWQALLSQNHEGSRRANFVARVFGHFVRKFSEPAVSFAAVEALDEKWCKPPLGHDECVRICADIARLEAERRGDL
jgi:hypothetical protein